MKNLMGMMKQAQEMQERMAKMQEELEEIEVSGVSGAGLVTVTLSGKGAMKAVKIDPSLLKEDEVEILEDLLVAAHNDAKAKTESTMQEKMKDITGGINLPPGMKLF